MSHQPFETWILDTDRLPGEDRKALNAHLESCAQCQTLQRRWLAAHRELRARPTAAPAPGFTQRWISSLAERRAREQRRQALRAFSGFFGGAVILLLVLAGILIANSTPAEWLAFLIRLASDSLARFDGLVSFVRLWLETTPLALNIALWIYLAVNLCLMSLGWVFALWRTSFIGVPEQ